jgi:hypothetical protein
LVSRFDHCELAQARGAQPEESIVISLLTMRIRLPAQARGAQPEESIVIRLPGEARQLPCAGACLTAL